MKLYKTLTICLPIIYCMHSLPAETEQIFNGPVRAQIIKVYDGDTLTARAFVWINLSLEINVRVSGIDTPELAGKCEEERILAKQAREFTKRILTNAKTVLLTNIHQDKYGGRVSADVIADGHNLGDMLKARGLAKPYSGTGPKPKWCP